MRGGGAAGAGAHHNPLRHGMILQGQLAEDGFGNVVVAAPVGGPLGVGELVHVVTAVLRGDLCGRRIHLVGVVHKVAGPPNCSISAIFSGAGGPRHDGNKRQVQQLGKVRFGDGGGAGAGLHNGGALVDPAVHQAKEEQ